MKRAFCWLWAVVLLSGCALNQHFISSPGRDRIVEVRSGDRWHLTLEEPADSPCRWSAESDDTDVEVLQRHSSGEVSYELRVHRGFDGPAVVTFRYARPGTRKPVKVFALSLFKRTGDAALWE